MSSWRMGKPMLLNKKIMNLLPKPVTFPIVIRDFVNIIFY